MTYTVYNIYITDMQHPVYYILYLITAGNRHKQNSWFCKGIGEDNFRLWWRRVHEDASQGMYMSKIEKNKFYCSNNAKSENAMLWRMLSRLETCIVYSCI